MSNPVNHLAGQTGNVDDLLRTLSDSELDDQAAYWAERHDAYKAAGEEKSAWWCSKQSSVVWRIKQERVTGVRHVYPSEIPPDTDTP